MLANTTFFSFAGVSDPARHRDYNRWHQLDHRPENLALPGVVYGERWVITPRCAGAGVVAEPRLAGVQYVNIYWYREPADASIAEWQELAERSFQWGRRPEIGYVTRPLMGFFATVRGYAAPRVLVSPDALVFRPARGVHLSVLAPAEPHSVATEAYYRWLDTEAVPAALELDGVAGAWTFSSRSTTLDPTYEATPGTSTTFAPVGADPGAWRVVLLFCDEDPVEVARALGHQAFVRADGAPAAPVDLAMSTPLCCIEPWKWDWFNEGASGE